MAMPRIMVQVSEPQDEFLKAEAFKLGIGVAELIRRIIDSYREGRK